MIPTPTPLQIERLSCTMLHRIIIVGFRALWCCNVPSDCQLDPERNIINLTCLQFSTYQVLCLDGILLKIQMSVCGWPFSLAPWLRTHLLLRETVLIYLQNHRRTVLMRVRLHIWTAFFSLSKGNSKEL